jgi:hypothetical protein
MEFNVLMMNLTKAPHASRAALHAIALSIGLFTSALGGVGTVSELTLPAGVTAGTPVVTTSWTLVAQPSANLATAKGEQVPAAGEVLVLSNATGKLVRKLRSTLPYPYAALSRRMAASGDIVVVTDGESSVRAFNCATGAHLWRKDFPSRFIDGIATDGLRVIIGMVDNVLVITNTLDIKTGDVVGASSWVESIDYFPGEAVAISGGWTVAGSPRSTVGAFNGAGVVMVVNPNGSYTRLLNPEPSGGAQFGQSVAISGHSLYVGCHSKRKVYHYDTRTLTLLETIEPPSSFYTAFGVELCASDHLLLIQSADGPWLYDRNTGNLNRIFQTGLPAGTIVSRGASLCGQMAVAPAGGRLFKATGVSGGRLDGEIAMVTGLTADGLSGPVFSKSMDAALNSAGLAVFAAKVSGSGTTALNDTGVWTGDSTLNSLLLREGTTSGTTKAGTPSRPFFSPDGTTAYSFTRSTTGALTLWKQNAGTMSPFVSAGGSIFISGDSALSVISKINGAGGVLNTAAAVNLLLKTGGTIHAGNDSVVLRPSLLSLVTAREGQPSAISGVNHGQINPRLATSSTRITFSSALTGSPTATNAAVFTQVLGGSTSVAMEKGQAAVGAETQFPDAKISAFVGEAVSAGVTVIRGTYKTGATTAHALWSYNHGTMAQHSVAWANGQVPGLPTGVKWSRFLKNFATADGRILFLAQIKGTGINPSNDLGFWTCNLGSNTPTLLVREGQALPQAHGAVIGTIQQVDAGSNGSWALLASLTRSPAGQNQVLLGGNVSLDTQHSIVMRKGIAIDGSEAAAMLLSISLPGNNTDAAGMGTTGQARLVEDGLILHRATFQHGTELAMGGVWGY